jgi:hypothetical protein
MCQAAPAVIRAALLFTEFFFAPGNGKNVHAETFARNPAMRAPDNLIFELGG